MSENMPRIAIRERVQFEARRKFGSRFLNPVTS
jgi:hypothetical protein